MKQIRHSKLSQAVRKAITKKMFGPAEHRATNFAAQRILLERLNLPKEKLARAKRLERHSIRLLEATTQISRGAPITIGLARQIIRHARNEISGFVQRNKQRLYPGQERQMMELYQNLGVDLAKLTKTPSELPTSLSMQFVRDATTMHFEELRTTIGEAAFKRYMTSQKRFQRVLARRGKWMEKTKENAPNN
ncbi:MAG: hypothetical protein WCW44_01775 [archaeon]